MRLKVLQSTLKGLWSTNRPGISLIEVILAGATFVMVVGAFTGAIISSQEASLRASTRSRALLMANEGLEAVRNIRDDNFLTLVDGTYGLVLQNNRWVLSGSSDTTDIFARSIVISTIDPETKQIQANVVWSGGVVNAGSVGLSTYLTDWHDIDSGGGGGETGQAAATSVDVSGASMQGDNKELRGISVQNTSGSPVVITTITASWTNSNKIERIRLDTSTIWSEGGPGTPLGEQSSGTLLNIQDFTINANSTASGNNFKFDEAMGGAQFTFVFTFADGTQKTFTVF